MTSPLTDIVCILTLGTSDEIQHLFMDFIKYYHKNLCSCLKELGQDPEEVVTWDLLMQELKKYGRYGWAVSIVLLPIFYLVEEDIVKLLEKFEGHYAQTHHHLEKKNSARLKRRFVEIIEQADQLGFL